MITFAAYGTVYGVDVGFIVRHQSKGVTNGWYLRVLEFVYSPTLMI